MARRGRGIEVLTAALLGLVSVATAVGAWQASIWNASADELARDAQDALDVSVNFAVLGEYSRRFDTEASAEAVRLAEQQDATTDPIEQALYTLRIQTRLGSTTPGFMDAWYAWRDAGFAPELDPLAESQYLLERDGPTHTYAYVSRQLGEEAEELKGRSGVIARAALVNALALFLFGISSIGRLQSIRYGILALGTAAFVGGLVLWILA